MAIKKYDTYKQCIIRTPTDEFTQVFETSWTFTDIRSWMLDIYCINDSDITSIEMSSITIYKQSK